MKYDAYFHGPIMVFVIQVVKSNVQGGLTVQGGCSQGSPSICMGKCFLVLITMDEHWASRFPDDRSPVRTCPMCRQFSRPTTSISLSPISVKGIKLK